MSIPVNARVKAVSNFHDRLLLARQFMAQQDAASAPERFKRLQARLNKARALLSFAPASGRPARFLDARSGWGRYQAQRARDMAAAAGLPDLRELVLERHLLLYAHSEDLVVWLSIRHERQLDDGFSEPMV